MSILKILAASIALLGTLVAWPGYPGSFLQIDTLEQQAVSRPALAGASPASVLSSTFLRAEEALHDPGVRLAMLIKTSTVGSGFMSSGCPGIQPNPMCSIDSNCAAICDYLFRDCDNLYEEEVCEARLCACKEECVDCPPGV